MQKDSYKALVYNVKTGKKVVVDPAQSRMSKMKRKVFSWAEAVKSYYDKEKHRLVMVTLTYKPEIDWQPNHIRDYMQAVKRYVKPDLLSYSWVVENHMSGRIHFHLYFVVNQGADIPMPDKSGMWPYGSSKIATGKSPYYLVSYLKKEYQKNFAVMPKGMRVFGVWVKPDAPPRWAYYRYRLSAFPGWLQEELEGAWYLAFLYPKSVKGGGWVVEIPADRRFGFLPSHKYFVSPWTIYDPKNADGLNNALMGDYMMGDTYA